MSEIVPDGTAERQAALEMFDGHAPGTSNRLTLGADKAYDAREFVGSQAVLHGARADGEPAWARGAR